MTKKIEFFSNEYLNIRNNRRKYIVYKATRAIAIALFKFFVRNFVTKVELL